MCFLPSALSGTGLLHMQKLSLFPHLQMFVVKTVDGDHVDLDAFDISGSKYTPEGEV